MMSIIGGIFFIDVKKEKKCLNMILLKSGLDLIIK